MSNFEFYSVRMELQKVVTALKKLEKGKLEVSQAKEKLKTLADKFNGLNLSSSLLDPKPTTDKHDEQLNDNIDRLLTKIDALKSTPLYKFTSMSAPCGCYVVDVDAYKAYMGDFHGCHDEDRCIEFTKMINNPSGEFMSVYNNPKLSIDEKNAKFMELYNSYGTSGTTRSYEELKAAGNLNEDMPLKDFHLLLKIGTIGQIWPNADQVLEYHFRNLKAKSVSQQYFNYLQNKCK